MSAHDENPRFTLYTHHLHEASSLSRFIVCYNYHTTNQTVLSITVCVHLYPLWAHVFSSYKGILLIFTLTHRVPRETYLLTYFLQAVSLFFAHKKPSSSSFLILIPLLYSLILYISCTRTEERELRDSTQIFCHPCIVLSSTT